MGLLDELVDMSDVEEGNSPAQHVGVNRCTELSTGDQSRKRKPLADYSMEDAKGYILGVLNEQKTKTTYENENQEVAVGHIPGLYTHDNSKDDSAVVLDDIKFEEIYADQSCHFIEPSHERTCSYDSAVYSPRMEPSPAPMKKTRSDDQGNFNLFDDIPFLDQEFVFPQATLQINTAVTSFQCTEEAEFAPLSNPFQQTSGDKVVKGSTSGGQGSKAQDKGPATNPPLHPSKTRKAGMILRSHSESDTATEVSGGESVSSLVQNYGVTPKSEPKVGKVKKPRARRGSLMNQCIVRPEAACSTEVKNHVRSSLLKKKSTSEILNPSDERSSATEAEMDRMKDVERDQLEMETNPVPLDELIGGFDDEFLTAEAFEFSPNFLESSHFESEYRSSLFDEAESSNTNGSTPVPKCEAVLPKKDKSSSFDSNHQFSESEIETKGGEHPFAQNEQENISENSLTASTAVKSDVKNNKQSISPSSLSSSESGAQPQPTTSGCPATRQTSSVLYAQSSYPGGTLGEGFHLRKPVHLSFIEYTPKLNTRGRNPSAKAIHGRGSDSKQGDENPGGRKVDFILHSHSHYQDINNNNSSSNRNMSTNMNSSTNTNTAALHHKKNRSI
eukprot:Nk52_evm18s2640 gene=Nk52_evmTU18s2640